MPKATDRAALVDLIENALTTELVHPGTGDGPVALPLPMFRNGTMPGEMARHFAEEAGLPHANAAKLVAEALVDLLASVGETGTAAAGTPAKATTSSPPATRPPRRHPAEPPAAAPEPPPPPTGGQAAGPITVTVNGETVMTDLADLQKFSADVQPGSRPPFWKKILIMAALEGVTRQAFRRVDITTDDDGGFIMRASVIHAADSG